jgi:hypothetical protein
LQINFQSSNTNNRNESGRKARLTRKVECAKYRNLFFLIKSVFIKQKNVNVNFNRDIIMNFFIARSKINSKNTDWKSRFIAIVQFLILAFFVHLIACSFLPNQTFPRSGSMVLINLCN